MFQAILVPFYHEGHHLEDEEVLDIPGIDLYILEQNPDSHQDLAFEAVFSADGTKLSVTSMLYKYLLEYVMR